jgi:hypothetical protein
VDVEVDALKGLDPVFVSLYETTNRERFHEAAKDSMPTVGKNALLSALT